MSSHKLLYIDDKIDISLTEKCEKLEKDLKFEYSEYIFNNNISINEHIDEIIKKNANIILLDIKLFGNDTNVTTTIVGYDLLHILKYYLPVTQFLLISSSIDTFINELNNLGESNYIKKEMNLKELKDKLEKMIKIHEFKIKSIQKFNYSNSKNKIKQFIDHVENNDFKELTDDTIEELIDLLKSGKNE